jgi:hypothetical protein
MDRTCSINGKIRNVYYILVGKSEGREHLKVVVVNGSITMEHKNMRYVGVDWIRLTQDTA